MSINRRELLIGTAAVAAGASVLLPSFKPQYHEVRRATRSRVAIFHVEKYSQNLFDILLAGMRLFPLDVRGKNVVLKPNLVDYVPDNAVNTDPLLVVAAGSAFADSTPNR